VNLAKPWIHLASLGINTPGSSDGNDNRSARGKATTPDVRPAYRFGPDEILRCLVANLGPFTCEIGGGGGGGGGRATVSAAEGEAAAGTEAGTAAVGLEEEATGGAAESEPGAALSPFSVGGGHHVPAKRAFTGDPNYDINAALAIPNSELDAQGIYHPAVTGARRRLYSEFAKTGQPVTWDVVRSIETQALIRAGMSSESASVTVNKAISALRASGVSGPVRIPWGGN
jgi:hypothetical protein